MGEWEVFKKLSKAPKSDAAVFLVTFILTVFVDLVVAIGIGIVLASLLFMKRMADVTDVRYILDADEDIASLDTPVELNLSEDVSFYEISGPFFFGAADKFIKVIREANYSTKVIILKMSNVPAMDATAYHGLEMLYDMCKRHNTEVVFVGLQLQPMQMLNKYGYIDMVGEKNFCFTLKDGIIRASEILSGEEYLEEETQELA